MRFLVLFLVAAVAAAVPAAVGAEPGSDFVVGAGDVAFTDFPSPGVTTAERFVVSAHADADGQNAHGSMILNSPLGDQRAVVTCLVVIGDTVVVGGTITSGFSYMGLSISHLAFLVKDNGEGQGAPDLASGYSFITRPPGFDPCAATVGAPIPYDVSGNFVVNDG